MNKVLAFVLFLSMLAASGCATGMIRKDRKNMADPSGPWSDADTRFVAETMVDGCASGTWVGRFNKARGRDPVVSVGTVDGRTQGHADALVFAQGLQMALINSGRVKFVAATAGRPQAEDARADYVLQGVVDSGVEETRGQRAFMFQADMELVDQAKGEKVWTGRKKVRKIVKRPRSSL